MAKEVSDPSEVTAAAAPEQPAGVKFIKNFNPHEVITLPGKKTFSFKGRTAFFVTDQDTVKGLRSVASRYGIIEDPPFTK